MSLFVENRIYHGSGTQDARSH